MHTHGSARYILQHADKNMQRRRIDHLVLAVRDLDAAGNLYRRMGFQVGPRNRHPWGTENRLVQFRTSFLELITVAGDGAMIPDHTPRHFSFGGFVRDTLARGEGLAMLVLDSDDAAADAAQFAADGIGEFVPFFFDRKGRKPDGTETHVAFTLAFALDPSLSDSAFFTCQQHFPEAFWNPALQRHDNGGRDVARVTLAVRDPTAHTRFLSSFTGVRPRAAETIYDLGENGCLHVSPTTLQIGLSAFRVEISDAAPLIQELRAERIAYDTGADGAVNVHDCHGVAIEFAVVHGDDPDKGPARQHVGDVRCTKKVGVQERP